MDAAESIDWESTQSHVLLNPRMPEEQRCFILETLSANTFPGHIWLSTSGSSGVLKCVALTKQALLNSAAAVNRHLQCSASDIWINPLPTFHVGGLAIYARSYLGKMRVQASGSVSEKWEPQQFVNEVIRMKATLTALVPTQIFDLVNEKLKAPPSLRAVVIGGGSMSTELYRRAVDLGWKVLPSYGLTECGSQVATATLESWKSDNFPLLQPLNHIKLFADEEGVLSISGSSLLTCYVFLDVVKKTFSVIDPKVNGWLITEDKVVMHEGNIRTISREQNFVKIGGESVDLLRLDHILEVVKLNFAERIDMSIFAMQDDRLGSTVNLVVKAGSVESNQIDWIITQFNELVHPFERIRKVHYVQNIPRTSLNKVIRPKLI